jgi:deoxyadenosine/deoxycytidine kinase
MIISVEGNIGSGKSTLVRWLSQELKDDERFVFIQEPVNMWLRNVDKSGESILTKFYNDQKMYAFPFQIMSYTSKLHLIREAVQNNPGKIIVTERCVYTDREVFAKMLYDEGKIEDVNYNIYRAMFDEFLLDEIDVDKFIYINTDPVICDKRIKKRDREGESSIPLEYLSKCNLYHKTWMENNEDNKVLVFDGNEEFETNIELLAEWKRQVMEFSDSKSVRTSEVLGNIY